MFCLVPVGLEALFTTLGRFIILPVLKVDCTFIDAIASGLAQHFCKILNHLKRLSSSLLTLSVQKGM